MLRLACTTSTVSTARRQYTGNVYFSGLRDGVLFDEWYWFDKALHGAVLVLTMVILEVIMMFADVGSTVPVSDCSTVCESQLVLAFGLNGVAYTSPFFTALELIGEFLTFSPLAYLF